MLALVNEILTEKGLMLKPGSAVDATLIAAPGSTKNGSGTRDLSDSLDAIYDQIERLKAGNRAKVEHPFRILKRQFGYLKTRYRGLMKNTAQITTLFALGNLWMARRALRKA